MDILAMANGDIWIAGLFLCVLDMLLAAGACVVCARKPTHILQLESYQTDGYRRAIKRQRDVGLEGILSFIITAGAFIIVMAAIGAGFLLSDSTAVRDTSSYSAAVWSGKTPVPWFSGTAAALVSIITALIHGRKKAKKPLKYTKRVVRLTAMIFAVNLIFIVLLCLLPLGPFAFLFPLIFQTPITLLAAYLIQPVENYINMGFFRDAQRRLEQRPDLIKIGITGSYGKTSTKFILAAILSEKYNVFASPSSFNTPMGLTRVIREQLTDEHNVFIAEMGARHAGDIAELCELVKPSIGALTAIGPQHLETFGSLETVENTKYELIASLPVDGAAFIADDGGPCSALAQRLSACPKTLAGVGPGQGVRASGIEVGLEGSSFVITFPDGNNAHVHTCLLGAHNIQNITLCCAVAWHLGLSVEQIADGVAKTPPVEHRLELIRGVGGNVVIDDAFNSNPAGAKAAMEVLSHFPGRRIVVTPGMVELGGEERTLNATFGEQMASACDIALLIGPKRAEPIREGLLAKGFDEGNIVVVRSLDDATAWLRANSMPGDVTLFENDLPDNYAE